MRPTTLASIAILAASAAVMVQVASAPAEEKLTDPVTIAPVDNAVTGDNEADASANIDATIGLSSPK